MSDEWEKIREALENPQYKWRTIEGIARDTGYEVSTVLDCLATHEDLVLRSSVPTKEGHELFTTKERYRTTSTVWDRLESAITNKVQS